MTRKCSKGDWQQSHAGTVNSRICATLRFVHVHVHLELIFFFSALLLLSHARGCMRHLFSHSQGQSFGFNLCFSGNTLPVTVTHPDVSTYVCAHNGRLTSVDRYSNLFLFQHICPLPTPQFPVKDVCGMEFIGGLHLYK